MTTCTQASHPGAACSVIECTQMNNWQIRFCPINNVDRFLCADVIPTAQTQQCIPNQSYGWMDQPKQLWTYGCNANFSVCYNPVQSFVEDITQNIFATTATQTRFPPPIRANALGPSFMTTPANIFPVINSSPLTIPRTTDQFSAAANATTAGITSTSSSVTSATLSDSLSDRLDNVDSVAAICGAVAGAIVLLLLIILIVVFLRRRKKSQKNDNTSDIEWNDYTGKSCTENGVAKTVTEDTTMRVRSIQNGNDKSTTNGTQIQENSKPEGRTGTNMNGNQQTRENMINSNTKNGTVQTQPNGGVNEQTSGQNKGFSV